MQRLSLPICFLAACLAISLPIAAAPQEHSDKSALADSLSDLRMLFDRYGDVGSDGKWSLMTDKDVSDLKALADSKHTNWTFANTDECSIWIQNLSDHFKSGQRLSLQNRPTEVAVQD